MSVLFGFQPCPIEFCSNRYRPSNGQGCCGQCRRERERGVGVESRRAAKAKRALVCKECENMPWRRWPAGCAGCGKPYADEQVVVAHTTGRSNYDT